jgi:probable DNA repair protein
LVVDKDELRPGVTCVTPTRRLAHHLRARADAACVARGLDVWQTPDIVSWAELTERMFMLDRQAGRVVGRWLPESAARLVWERIAQRDPAVAGLVSPGLVGRSAYESWRRMHAYRIPTRALTGEGSLEAEVFARWTVEYGAWLEEHDWVDPSLAIDRLHPSGAGAALELAGFDVLTPAQQALLERLVNSGVVVSHRRPDPRRGAAVWVECLDRNAEFDAAARWAARRLDREPGARLCVVVPGLAQKRDAVRRAIERVLVPAATVAGGPAPESHGFELAAARALSDQAVVAAALQAIDAFARPTDLAVASRLLRSLFLAAAGAEMDPRARLDAHIRRNEGPDLALPRLARLAAERHCPQFDQALRSSLALAQDWPRRALPSRWSRLWFDLLGAMGWPGPDLDSDEHQARQRWQGLVAEFGACDDYVGPLPAGDAAALLRDLARGVLFEPQELRAPLLVIDPETCAGMTFDGLWVCGLDTTAWPEPMSPDPFLPRSWQVRQRVPGASAEIAAEDSRRALERLCRSADEVILSVPQFDDEAPLLPSALLGEAPRGRLDDQWRAPALASAAFAARPALEVLRDGAMPAVPPEESSRGGARLLELQAACPFRAQAEFRLGARALEAPELGVAAAERGDLVHDVLARIWRGLGDQLALRRLSTEVLQETVRAAVAAAIDAARQSTHGVMRHLMGIEAAWLEARVGELLAADLEREEFTVEAIEQGCSIDIGGLTLALRIDRVDRLQDGSVAVIDYKTGADADIKAWLDERPKLPQLPRYAEAVGPDRVTAVAFGRVRTGDTGYRGLARDAAPFPGLRSPGSKGWPREFASWEELKLTWRRRLAALASEHVAGDARLAPDPSHACTYCRLGALCRIGETRLGLEGEGADDE